MYQLLYYGLSLAAEEPAAEASSNVSLVLPEKSELIAGIIAFAIVFFFVWKKALPSIDRTLEARQEAIRSRLQEAERAKTEAESLLTDYKAQLAEVKVKQNEIIEEARTAGEVLKADIVAKAQAEANLIVTKARDEASAEKSRLLSDTRAEVANLSIDLAEKVVAANLDRATQLGLVESYLADLEQ